MLRSFFDVDRAALVAEERVVVLFAALYFEPREHLVDYGHVKGLGEREGSHITSCNLLRDHPNHNSEPQAE